MSDWLRRVVSSFDTDETKHSRYEILNCVLAVDLGWIKRWRYLNTKPEQVSKIEWLDTGRCCLCGRSFMQREANYLRGWSDWMSVELARDDF
jgi:hypothetical protein